MDTRRCRLHWQWNIISLTQYSSHCICKLHRTGKSRLWSPQSVSHGHPRMLQRTRQKRKKCWERRDLPATSGPWSWLEYQHFEMSSCPWSMSQFICRRVVPWNLHKWKDRVQVTRMGYGEQTVPALFSGAHLKPRTPSSTCWLCHCSFWGTLVMKSGPDPARDPYWPHFLTIGHTNGAQAALMERTWSLLRLEVPMTDQSISMTWEVFLH